MGIEIPFLRDFNFKYDRVDKVSPLIRRVVANNPNFFTCYGTNTYILGSGNVALVDPGPDLQEHISAIVDALKGEHITHILITHSHFDHWPGYLPLQERFGAKTYGYDPNRENNLTQVKSDGNVRELSNQERFDQTGFKPDVTVEHGDILEGDGWSVECVHTPGHASNHMCFQLREEKALFSGDHIMGWSTSVISPPSGNMEDYMDSLDLVLKRDDISFLPAHGPVIDNPKPFVDSFIAHRIEREQEILHELENGVDTVREMVPRIYKNISKFLYPAAERSTLAAVLYMEKRGILFCSGTPCVTSKLRLS